MMVDRWDDRLGNSSSFAMAMCEAQVRADYAGVNVSVERKLKQLDKWGRNPNQTAASGAIPVNSLGTDPALPDPGNNTVTHIVGGSGDTQTVFVEGHYWASGNRLVFVVQSKTLTATTPVALDTPLARCGRLYVKSGGAPTGPVQVTIGSGGTAVVQIEAGEAQSQHCQTSTSYRDWWFVTSFGGSSLGTGSARVTFRMEARRWTDTDGTAITNPPWRPLTRDWLLNDGGRVQFDREKTPIIIGPNTDIRITTDTSANNTDVTANIVGWLAIDFAEADATPPAAV